jgi:hypothetical protein
MVETVRFLQPLVVLAGLIKVMVAGVAQPLELRARTDLEEQEVVV